jgi:hypothetical protein
MVGRTLAWLRGVLWCLDSLLVALEDLGTEERKILFTPLLLIVLACGGSAECGWSLSPSFSQLIRRGQLSQDDPGDTQNHTHRDDTSTVCWCQGIKGAKVSHRRQRTKQEGGSQEVGVANPKCGSCLDRQRVHALLYHHRHQPLSSHLHLSQDLLIYPSLDLSSLPLFIPLGKVELGSCVASIRYQGF